MADKKITGFDPAAALTINDLFGVCQDPATGEMLRTNGAALRSFVLGGTTNGARIYFIVGMPDPSLGVDGDVTFNTQDQQILQKAAGVWLVRDTYGSFGGMGKIRFTTNPGSDGLAADGLSYTSSELVDVSVQMVMLGNFFLIERVESGVVAADEYSHDAVAGKLVFGQPVTAGFRMTITYSEA